MKATPIEHDPGEEMVREANEAMMLMVSGVVWNVLVKQAKAEGKTPGVILDAMMRAYLEQKGAPEVIEYLNSLGV